MVLRMAPFGFDHFRIFGFLESCFGFRDSNVEFSLIASQSARI
jgi:hypothetical protein